MREWVNYTLTSQDNILLITAFFKSNKCRRLHGNLTHFSIYQISPSCRIRFNELGVGGFCSLCMGTCTGQRSAPPYMGQGAVMRMKHKAS